MRILIVGAGGFLGRALSEVLVERGHEVFGCVRAPLASAVQGVEYLYGDILEGAFPVPSRIDCCFYLAQSPHYREFPERARHLFGVNALGVIDQARACAASGVSLFFNASTGNVYAPSFDPMAESHPLRRDQAYSLSKVMGEEGVSLFAESMQTVSLRIFGLFGHGEKSSSLAANLRERVRRGEPVKLQSAAHENETEGLRVSLVRVSDAAHAVAKVAEKGLAGDSLPRALNIGGAEPVSLKTFAQALAVVEGREPVFALAQGERAFDLVADTTLLESICGVPPRTPLHDALDYDTRC